jgi:hypothetical protein
MWAIYILYLRYWETKTETFNAKNIFLILKMARIAKIEKNSEK